MPLHDIFIKSDGIVSFLNLILRPSNVTRCSELFIGKISLPNNLKQSERIVAGSNSSSISKTPATMYESTRQSYKSPKTATMLSMSSLFKLAPMMGSRSGLMFNQASFMSYDSSNKVHNTIHNLITNSKKRVFVFMKGVPSEPLCRYSGVVIQILDAYGVEYDSCDVLENAEIRQEIKSYSDWPTIPQVYMDGKFIGGCDILLQMHQSGEMKQLFGGDDSEASK